LANQWAAAGADESGADRAVNVLEWREGMLFAAAPVDAGRPLLSLDGSPPARRGGSAAQPSGESRHHVFAGEEMKRVLSVEYMRVCASH
jgi:hypothetical protein